MGYIKKITQMTQNRFLNLYHLDARNRVGGEKHYYVASRAKSIEELELSGGKMKADGVAIFGLYGEKRDKVVLIRQYRYPIDGYVYEFPAGLVDEGEAPETCAVREMKEETGLTFHPVSAPDAYQRPFYTTVGMTDESVSMVFGYADGKISEDGLEEDETIETVIADKEEIRRILKEERVAVICAYHLMHFLAEEEPFAFLGLKKEDMI